MAAVIGRGETSPRRELAVLLIAGAVSAGAVLLATRQALAKVVVLAPRPLPTTVTEVTGQDLRPAIAALALAALASLAAVLATRRVLRRITGLITAALGAGIVALAVVPVSAAEAVAAAGRSAASPASGTGAGAAAGSVTAGTGSGGPDGGSVGGFPVHVMLGGSGWRALMVCGGVLVALSGIAIVVRSGRLPGMSRRYERPGAAVPQVAVRVGDAQTDGGGDAAEADQAGHAARAGAAAGRRGRTASAATGSSMWESLSAGEDPTDLPE